MSPVIYVTSFNERLFNLSALRLLQSFVKFNIDAKLLICYEDDKKTNYLKELKKIEGTNFIFVNISNYDYLNNFLKNHKDIIYKKHGGSADSTNYWNDRWSLWFRKVASLKYALDHFKNYEFLVWIDCDCFFKKHLSTKFLRKGFNKKDCFYYLGEYRKNSKWELAAGVETGFIGWRKGGGYKLLSDIINEFNDRKFTKYKRWDDGYVIRMVIEKSNIKCEDLALAFTYPGGNVIGKKCYFRDHIIHNKGSHHHGDKILLHAIRNPKMLRNQIVKMIINKKKKIEEKKKNEEKK